MATSAAVSVASGSWCNPQTRSVSKPQSPPMAFLSSPQIGHKSLIRPLRSNNGVSPVGPRRNMPGLVVKASVDGNVEVFTKEYLAVSLAKYVADLSQQFIQDRGYFTVVLSGNSVKYLRKLVEPPYVNTIPWSKWQIFWVDERVVPKTHVDSNYKLAYDGFISKVPIPPYNVYSIDDALPAEGVADVYETTLRRLVAGNVIASSTQTKFPKFDLILLDMGPDGQVGALFPNHPVVNESTKWVTYVKDAPKPPPERITLTLPVINSASNIAMVVTGAGKADAVYTAIEKEETYPKLPVQMVSPEGELKWFLDKGAASKLYK
ncbi:probable 6-phosphogluconolactonase 4, chloroplastic [Neltuma alba]|uniref:probable 6-phosphogluconolactonase 4, chloroplastic n=1 Tax=Neltuma alba TaxID=207710 RepID=UPI0010A57B69|nr:probable 6-phosphogluconolactonase 4, chloroplastic [Prosopis alba]